MPRECPAIPATTRTNKIGATLADGSSNPLSRSRAAQGRTGCSLTGENVSPEARVGSSSPASLSYPSLYEVCVRSREGYPMYGNTGSREYEEHIGAFPSESDLLIPNSTPNACARGLQLIDRCERELASRGTVLREIKRLESEIRERIDEYNREGKR